MSRSTGKLICLQFTAVAGLQTSCNTYELIECDVVRVEGWAVVVGASKVYYETSEVSRCYCKNNVRVPDRGAVSDRGETVVNKATGVTITKK